MENNHRKAFNLYTQGQRWAVRVLVFVGLLGSFVPQNALAFNIFRVIQCVIVGSAVWGDGVMGPSGVSAQLTQACLNEGECPTNLGDIPLRRILGANSNEGYEGVGGGGGTPIGPTEPDMVVGRTKEQIANMTEEQIKEACEGVSLQYLLSGRCDADAKDIYDSLHNN